MLKYNGLKNLGKSGLICTLIAIGGVTVTGFVAPTQAQVVATYSRIDVSGNIRIAADTIRIMSARRAIRSDRRKYEG